MAQTTTSPKKLNALPIIFIVITIGILVAGGYVVYNTVNKNPNSPLSQLNNVAQIATGNGLPKLTESDFVDIADPLVRKHFAAQANKTTFRTTSTSDGRGESEETVTEVDYRSMSDMRMRMKEVSAGKETSHLITIGDTTYLKDVADNSWWMQTQKPADVSEDTKTIEDYSPEKLKEEYLKKSTVTYTKVGEESCGTLTCHKYQEKDGDTTRTFWFDTKELLLRKETYGYGEFTSTTLYSYDNISITKPSPTKNVPEGSSIYEMMGVGMMSKEERDSYEAAKKMLPTEEELKQIMNDSETINLDTRVTEESIDDNY